MFEKVTADIIDNILTYLSHHFCTDFCENNAENNTKEKSDCTSDKHRNIVGAFHAVINSVLGNKRGDEADYYRNRTEQKRFCNFSLIFSRIDKGTL